MDDIVVNYTGILSKRLEPISVSDKMFRPEKVKEYEQKAQEREDALFSFYAIDKGSPNSWRELALLLAEDNIPAFGHAPGRPQINKLENICWMRTFFGVKRRDNCSDAEAYRIVSEMVGADSAVVSERLKTFRRSNRSMWDAKWMGDDRWIAKIDEESGLKGAGEEFVIGLLLEAADGIDTFIEDMKEQEEQIRLIPYQAEE